MDDQYYTRQKVSNSVQECVAKDDNISKRNALGLNSNLVSFMKDVDDTSWTSQASSPTQGAGMLALISSSRSFAIFALASCMNFA